MSDDRTADINLVDNRKFRCPACGFRGEPVYLAKRGKHPDPKKPDYSDRPMCPYCINLAMWRMATQMVEE